MNGKIELQTKKQRFNIIDFLIILIVVAIAGSIVLRKLQNTDLDVKTKFDDAEITFYINSLDNTVADAIARIPKDEMLYLDDGSELGVIREDSIDVQKAIAFVESIDGVLHQTENDLASDLRGTISVKGRMTDAGFMLNGTTLITPNAWITMHSKSATVSFQIISVSLVTENQQG